MGMGEKIYPWDLKTHLKQKIEDILLETACLPDLPSSCFMINLKTKYLKNRDSHTSRMGKG